MQQAVQMDWAGVITKCDAADISVNHWSLGFGGDTTAGKIVMFNGMTMWDTGITLDQIAGDWHEIASNFWRRIHKFLS